MKTVMISVAKMKVFGDKSLHIPDGSQIFNQMAIMVILDYSKPAAFRLSNRGISRSRRRRGRGRDARGILLDSNPLSVVRYEGQDSKFTVQPVFLRRREKMTYIVKTTGEAGGLKQPWKGMVLACVLRRVEQSANRITFTCSR